MRERSDVELILGQGMLTADMLGTDSRREPLAVKGAENPGP